MRLLLFRSLWTNRYNLNSAIADCVSGFYDGIEGPVPSEDAERNRFRAMIRDSGLPFIAEITTGGGYVPDRSQTPADHLEEFKRKAEIAQESAPLFFTVLAGCDAWPAAKNVELLGRAMEAADDLGAVASFETHRSRATFSPWATRELLRQLPDLRLTCDFSHWCCVTERLVLDEEPELLALVSERADHIHARIGYAQGPQVPHPAAPEYALELAAHERWWDAVWSAPERQNRGFATMTPEFGPDGYLQALPFSQKPAADLDEINRWMAERQRARFSGRPLSAAA